MLSHLFFSVPFKYVCVYEYTICVRIIFHPSLLLLLPFSHHHHRSCFLTFFSLSLLTFSPSLKHIKCEFTKDSLDLTVIGLKGKNYRLFKTNLENDIVPSESKFTVKANKIVVK
jgi:hypothetical protein